MTWSPCLVRSSVAAGGGAAMSWATRWSIVTWSSSRVGPDRTRLRAVAFDLKMFFSVVDKDPVEVTPADVFELPGRVSAAIARWSGWRIGESGLSARTIARRLSSVSGLYAYLVARGDTRCGRKPGAAGSVHAAGRAARAFPDGAVGAGAADAAEDPGAGRGRRVAGVAAHQPGPGDGPGDGARRPAPLRGPGVAPERRAGRRTASVHRRRQRRPPTGGADRESVLRRGRRLPARRTPPTVFDGPSVRGVERAPARASRCRRKVSTRSWPAPAAGPG